jgi:glucose-1-phosphate cytidylyltransferase
MLNFAEWINGGFFVCEPSVFDYLSKGDATVFEQDPLQGLARDGLLYTYRHNGFWKCMDTLRDKQDLNQMWQSGSAKWKTW